MFSPLALGALRLRNRIIKTATYEGMIASGLPTEVLVRHHTELARGGVGMTTIAYCSVSPEGRTFAEQMVMGTDSIPPLRALTDAVHREGAAAMLQLGHCGGFSKNEELGWRGPLGPSSGFNAYGALKGMPHARAMREDDLRRTEGDFVRAARAAIEAGFDAIELHLGHGYLLSQFLSPHRNHRVDAYGGSLENRMRFPLQVVRAVRAALPDAPIFVKTNLDDGVKGGLDVTECIEVCLALEREGVTAIVLSGGLVSHSALYLLRGGRPLAEMIEVEKSAMQKVALAAFGPALVKAVPFEPLFFLAQAKRVRAAVSLPLVYVGGATSMADLTTLSDAGFEMVAMGRALLREPDLIHRYQRGEATFATCEPCNACITEMDRPGGVLCAKEPWQLERRAREVAERRHLTIAR
jgi:2,4-dienoyl-CoA reductase-like NADH-dependent reductase (Old Yellow Enzyme family)